MSFKIKTSDPFDAEVKRLSKKYRSLKLDLHELGKELMENPFQGVEIAPNIRKVAWLSLPREGVNRVARE